MNESRPFEMPRDVAAVYLDGVREIRAAVADLLAGEFSPERCEAAKHVILRVRERTEPPLHAFWESAGELRPAVSDFRVENNEAFQAVVTVIGLLAVACEEPVLWNEVSAYREELPNCVAEFDRLIDGWGLARATIRAS